MTLCDDQIAMCNRHGALFEATADDAIVGASRSLSSGAMPLHGIRHLAEGGICGWYLWAGDYSEADDFFEPVHVSHLAGICPDVLPYLGLAPGWRFLLAPNSVDVWYDVKLLNK
jgi:hypothetical protein